MKNLKVRNKLLTGFLIVITFTIVIGLVGILNLNSLNSNYTYAVDMYGKPLEDAGYAISALHAVRAELRAAMLFTGERDRVSNQETLVRGYLDDFEARMAAYEPTIVSSSSRDLFTEAMNVYNSDFLPAVNKVLTDAENGIEQQELVAYMVNTIKPAVDLIIDNLGQCMENKALNLDTTSANGAALANSIFFNTVLASGNCNGNLDRPKLIYFQPYRQAPAEYDGLYKKSRGNR